jgi:hypothetical protein
MFICLRIKYEKINEEIENEKFKDKKDLKDKIIIYSIELELPIATFDINDGIYLNLNLLECIITILN